jgi:hypothetical protein
VALTVIEALTSGERDDDIEWVGDALKDTDKESAADADLPDAE